MELMARKMFEIAHQL